MDISYLEMHFHQAITLSLVYGAKMTVPIEVVEHSARLTLTNKLYDPHDQMMRTLLGEETLCREQIAILS